MSSKARGLLLDDIAGFKVEVLHKDAKPAVLISNEKGFPQFLLIPNVLASGIELIVNRGFAEDDIAAASAVVGDNFDAIMEIWNWHQFWTTIDAT